MRPLGALVRRETEQPFGESRVQSQGNSRATGGVEQPEQPHGRTRTNTDGHGQARTASVGDGFS